MTNKNSLIKKIMFLETKKLNKMQNEQLLKQKSFN